MYSVIIVDDEAGARSILEKYINEFVSNFEIKGIFEDGEEAIEFLKNNAVNVILTDIKMTKVSGLDLAKFVYENYPNIKVVIISGFGDFEYARTALNFKITNFLLKVIDKDELVRVMKNIENKLNCEKLLL